MKILALDQATITSGYAIYDYKNKKLVDSGLIKAEKKLPINERIKVIVEKVLSIIDKEKIEAVCYEQIPKIKGVTTAIKLAKLAGAIEYILTNKNMLYAEINVNSHKKQFGITSRKRDEQKAEAIKIVKMLYKKEVTDDEADAISIGNYFVNNIVVEVQNEAN